MEERHDLLAQRRAKLEELRAEGCNPFANDFRPSHSSAEVHANHAAYDAAALADDLAQVPADDRLGGEAEELGEAAVGEAADQVLVVGDRHRRDAVNDEAQLGRVVARRLAARRDRCRVSPIGHLPPDDSVPPPAARGIMAV